MGKLLVFIILTIIGLINIFSPETAWYINCGWRYKNAEPSELALNVNMVSGFIILSIEILFILLSLGSCVGTSSCYVIFKDGSRMNFTTLNDYFNVSYDGMDYQVNSSALASFLIDVAE